jgi:hypothetical protein
MKPGSLSIAIMALTLLVIQLQTQNTDADNDGIPDACACVSTAPLALATLLDAESGLGFLFSAQSLFTDSLRFTYPAGTSSVLRV